VIEPDPPQNKTLREHLSAIGGEPFSVSLALLVHGFGAGRLR
jgi:hypothetical protein